MTKRSAFVPSFITRSYRAQFIVCFLFVLVVIGSVGAVGYVQVNDTIEDDTYNSLNSSATMQADSLSEWIGKMETQASFVSGSERLDGDPDQVQMALQSIRNQHTENVVHIHVVDLDSERVYASTDSTVDGDDLSDVDHPWASESAVSEFDDGARDWSSAPYQSSRLDRHMMAFGSSLGFGSGQYVVVTGELDSRIDRLHQPDANYSTTIHDTDGNVILSDAGAESKDVDEDSDDSVVASAPISGTNWMAVTTVPTGEAFAVRDTVGMNVALIVLSAFLALGLVAAGLGRRTVTPLARLRRETQRMEEGDLEADFETSRTDEIGQLFGAFDSMQHSLRERIQDVEDARDEADRTAAHLEEKATEYSAVMRDCAEGDFTRRMDPDSENEAMEEIALEFNEMVGDIEETTEELKEFATDVATASEQVTASTEEVRAASTQVADSVQAISSGAERQNESLQSVDHEMGGLSSTVEEIASSSNEVADIASRTAESGEDGREAADAAVEGMNQIETESERAVDEIEALEAEITQIDELAEFISQVAEQTNVLALNANIEAARSSEAGGDGFGVVANEVKELATETKEAAADIEDRIEDIKSQTHRTASEVQETSDQVAKHREAVENAAESLERIATYAQETNEGVQDISAATEQQAASTQEVVAMVDETAAISEETSSEAENVAAAAEEQTSSLTEVSRAVADLSQQALRLSGQLGEFETNAGITGPDSAGLDDLSIDDGQFTFDETDPVARDGDSDSDSDADGTDPDQPPREQKQKRDD